MLHFGLIGISLGDAARAAFEDLMAQGNYEFQSDFFQKRIEAHRADGKVAGRAEDVLTVLDARGITVSAEQKARVLDCIDEAALDRWIRKAVTVATAEELFSD